MSRLFHNLVMQQLLYKRRYPDDFTYSNWICDAVGNIIGNMCLRIWSVWWWQILWRNLYFISLRFSRDSEANALDSLENPEDMFPRYS